MSFLNDQQLIKFAKYSNSHSEGNSQFLSNFHQEGDQFNMVIACDISRSCTTSNIGMI